MSVISDLYYGNIIPFERSYKRDGKYSKKLAECTKTEEVLRLTLSEEQSHLFDKLKQTEGDLHTIDEVDAFSAGFRIGMKISAEVFAPGKEYEVKT